MNVVIHPGNVNGIIRAKPSKSISQRAIIASSLASEESIIFNCSQSEDVLNLLKVIENIGCMVTWEGDMLKIKGRNSSGIFDLNIGESGLASRILIPVLSTQKEKFQIDGIGTLKKRPFNQFDSIFRSAGVRYISNNGYLPVSVSGPLKSGSYNFDASVGSQFLSGLLFAFPLTKGYTEIKVDSLKSTPYIDMTIDVLKQYGVNIQNEDYDLFKIEGDQHYIGSEIHVENDWSSAAFMLVAAAIAGSVCIKGMNPFSRQGDKIILDVLDQAGAFLQIKENEIICKRMQLKAFTFNATDYPDLFPPLVALASNCTGTSEIKGVHRLIHKESNRCQALLQEFGKLGIKGEMKDDILLVTGGEIKPATLSSWNDHRIAMALAIAALKSEHKVNINNFDCVKKSYPEFLSDLKSIGVSVL